MSDQTSPSSDASAIRRGLEKDADILERLLRRHDPVALAKIRSGLAMLDAPDDAVADVGRARILNVVAHQVGYPTWNAAIANNFLPRPIAFGEAVAVPPRGAKVVRVTIERHEGPTDQVDKPVTFEGPSALDQANGRLSNWATTVSPGGGYDKCGFTVEFEGGLTYQGRYDLERDAVADIGRQVVETLRFNAGDWRPEHVSAESHAALMADYELAGVMQEAVDFLASIDVRPLLPFGARIGEGERPDSSPPRPAPFTPYVTPKRPTTFDRVWRDLSIVVPAKDNLRDGRDRYLVRSGLTAHRAFETREGLLRWMNLCGLTLSVYREIPEPGDIGVTFRVKGYYVERAHMDLAEFNALEGIETRILSNGAWTRAVITTGEDDAPIVNYCNPNVRGRVEFDYHESRRLENDGQL